MYHFINYRGIKMKFILKKVFRIKLNLIKIRTYKNYYIVIE